MCDYRFELSPKVTYLQFSQTFVHRSKINIPANNFVNSKQNSFRFAIQMCYSTAKYSIFSFLFSNTFLLFSIIQISDWYYCTTNIVHTSHNCCLALLTSCRTFNIKWLKIIFIFGFSKRNLCTQPT